MLSAKILLIGSTSVGGASAVCGGGYYLNTIGAFGNKVPDPITETYFVIAREVGNTQPTSIKGKCASLDECALYKLEEASLLSVEQPKESSVEKITNFSDIKPHSKYVLTITSIPLKLNDFAELSLGDDQRMLFEVKSTTSINEEKKITLSLPKGIVPKTQLKKITTNFDDLSQEQKDSRKYHFDLYPTYIDRTDIDHDDYVIFNWRPNDNSNYEIEKSPLLLWDANSEKPVDKYLFKPFGERANGSLDDVAFTATIYNHHPTLNVEFEIYEIKDEHQKSLNDLFAKKANGNKPTNRYFFNTSDVDWVKVAKENKMITKLSALKLNRFYKFVFKNLNEFPKKDALKSTTIKASINGKTASVLFSWPGKYHMSDTAQLCHRFKDNTENTGCRVF